jgi:hypothetical protein
MWDDNERVLTIPWVFAVKLLRAHLSAALYRAGHSPEAIRNFIDDSLVNKPSDEFIKLAQAVLDEAGAAYAAQLTTQVPVNNVLHLKPKQS